MTTWAFAMRAPSTAMTSMKCVLVMEAAKAYDGPVLIHAITRKGKGYAPAEASNDCYHGVATFDVESGKQNKAASRKRPTTPSSTARP